MLVEMWTPEREPVSQHHNQQWQNYQIHKSPSLNVQVPTPRPGWYRLPKSQRPPTSLGFSCQGFFTLCSGPRSGPTGLNLPHLSYLLIRKPSCNLLCDLRVSETNTNSFKKWEFYALFRLWDIFSSKNDWIPTLLFNIASVTIGIKILQ